MMQLHYLNCCNEVSKIFYKVLHGQVGNKSPGGSVKRDAGKAESGLNYIHCATRGRRFLVGKAAEFAYSPWAHVG